MTRATRTMQARSRRAAPLVVIGLAAVMGLASMACTKTRVVRSADDDNAKAFAELERNDRDPTPPVASTVDPALEKKGPIYPAPFTAEQIRDATTEGRTYRFKVEVPNQPTREYVLTFRKVDASGAEIVGGTTSKRMGWLTLQRQSEFPKAQVTTRAEKLKTPAGKFECLVYEVAGDDGEVFTYYFARLLPGAPVFFYVERNGTRLRTTTLIEHVPGT